MHFSVLDIIVEKDAKMLSFCSIEVNGVDVAEANTEEKAESMESMLFIGLIIDNGSRNFTFALFGITLINYTWVAA